MRMRASSDRRALSQRAARLAETAPLVKLGRCKPGPLQELGSSGLDTRGAGWLTLTALMSDLAVDNAVSLFVEQPLAEGLATRPAIVTPSGTHTYGDLAALTDRAARGLRGLGVEPEQRVAILMPDGVAFAATFFGTLKLGAVAVSRNTRLAGKDLRFILDDCRAKVVVADRALASALGDGLRARVLTFEELAAAARGESPAAEPVGGDAMAFWLYTSGTTGTPKAAMHCHRNLLACPIYADGGLGVSPADRVFSSW